MQAEQSRFEGMLEAEGWEGEEGEDLAPEEAAGSATHLGAMAGLLGQELCVLCHQQQSPAGSSQLSFVCHATRYASHPGAGPSSPGFPPARSGVLRHTNAQALWKDPFVPTTALGRDNQVSSGRRLFCGRMDSAAYKMAYGTSFSRAIPSPQRSSSK